MALVQMNFESQYLGNNHQTTIILPDKPRGKTPAQFYSSGEKYKVLWLLHGGFGDHSDWLRKTKIELYACEKDLAIVMPSALNSGYSNWPEFGMGFNMYDYLFDELMPLIYNWYPVSDKREDNFVAGLSMGGGGTMKYALGHPELFAGAAVLSMAPGNVREQIEALDSAPADDVRAKRLRRAIEDAGSVEAYLASSENIWDRFKQLAGCGKLPKLYFATGTEDFLYPAYTKFKAYAQEIGLDATFEEGPGGHEWRFWDTYIQKALAFFGLERTDEAGNPF